MVTENSDNIDEVVEETPKKTKAKKPKYDAVQELPEVSSDSQQYVFTFNISYSSCFQTTFRIKKSFI